MSDFIRRTTVMLPDFLHEPHANMRLAAAACFDSRASAQELLSYDTRWVPPGGKQFGIGLSNLQHIRMEKLCEISRTAVRDAIQAGRTVPRNIIPAQSTRDMYVRALVFVLERKSPRYVAYERERVLDYAKKHPYKLPSQLVEYCKAHRPDVIAASAQAGPPADQNNWIDHALRTAGRDVTPMLSPDRLKRAILGHAVSTGLHAAIAAAYDNPDALRELNERIAAVINPSND